MSTKPAAAHLFNMHNLTATQAKSLLEKVRLLVEAGEMGLFNSQH